MDGQDWFVEEHFTGGTVHHAGRVKKDVLAEDESVQPAQAQVVVSGGVGVEVGGRVGVYNVRTTGEEEVENKGCREDDPDAEEEIEQVLAFSFQPRGVDVDFDGLVPTHWGGGQEKREREEG